MKGFIFKQNGGTFYLRVNDKIIASSEKVEGKHFLSTKNCEKISLGYDLDELAKSKYPIQNTGSMFMPNRHEVTNIYRQEGFYEGAKAIIELMSDKRFTEDDLKRACSLIFLALGDGGDITTDEVIQHLQKTKWEVEIEMEWKPISDSCTACASSGIHMAKPCDHPNDCCHWQPKLDENGCLILKRVD